MDNIFQKRLDRIKDSGSELIWALRFDQIDSILQKGPQCGIVALGMVLKKLNISVSVDELMQKAKDLKFTISGEIFDVEYLSSLGKVYYEKNRIEKLENDPDQIKLFDALINEKLVIIAYDCDFNFEPAFKNGKKAHWAIISGIFAPIQPRVVVSDNDETPSSIVDLNSGLVQSDAIITRLKSHYNENTSFGGDGNFRDLVYCVGKQGKSSQYGVWRLRDLILSNRQLSLIDDEKVTDDNFIKPDHLDLSKSLASKYIVFE